MFLWRMISLTTRPKTWVRGRWLLGFAGSNSYGDMSVPLLRLLCFRQKDFSATGRSLFQRNPNECVVSECDCEASIMRRPWPTRGCCAMGKNKIK